MSGYLSQLAAALAPITLQIDLATAAVALIALVFSIWSFRNQRRVTIEGLRIQRDNDIIGWSNRTIETLVGIEFLARQFEGDVIVPGTAPPLKEDPSYILDRLVQIYDLIKDLDPRNPMEIEKTKTTLLLRKRSFIAHAQREVDPKRRLQFLQG